MLLNFLMPRNYLASNIIVLSLRTLRFDNTNHIFSLVQEVQECIRWKSPKGASTSLGISDRRGIQHRGSKFLKLAFEGSSSLCPYAFPYLFSPMSPSNQEHLQVNICLQHHFLHATSLIVTEIMFSSSKPPYYFHSLMLWPFSILWYITRVLFLSPLISISKGAKSMSNLGQYA